MQSIPAIYTRSGISRDMESEWFPDCDIGPRGSLRRGREQFDICEVRAPRGSSVPGESCTHGRLALGQVDFELHARSVPSDSQTQLLIFDTQEGNISVNRVVRLLRALS